MESNNKVILVGEIGEEFIFDHSSHGEDFYRSFLKIERKSGYTDKIPFVISKKIIDVRHNLIGLRVKIEGQFRSYNKYEGDKNILVLYVFVDMIKESEEDFQNVVELYGFICKYCNLRNVKTRDVSDVLLAVNRRNRKSDYIPCLAWNRNAQMASILDVGTRLSIKGRIQSREYIKRISEDEIQTKTAYEVSISELEVIDDEKI